MNWYIVTRRTYTDNRTRLLCWQHIDAVMATSHDHAGRIARKRNPWKPDQDLVTQRVHCDHQIEVAEELNEQRTKQIEQLEKLIERKVMR
jgi:hypothetical protein